MSHFPATPTQLTDGDDELNTITLSDARDRFRLTEAAADEDGKMLHRGTIARRIAAEPAELPAAATAGLVFANPPN